MPYENVIIEPVTDRRALKDFIRFPFRLYKDDPYWVPPLLMDRKQHFNLKKNPFYEHAHVQLFRALADGETVGVIAAIVNDMHIKTWKENIGFFGEFECVNDQNVANALFSAAGNWLAEQGMDAMRGPASMDVNDILGLLIDGEPGQPVILMAYNPPYYEQLYETYGLTKSKDVYAYYADLEEYGEELEGVPEKVHQVAEIARQRFNVTIEHVSKANFDEKIAEIKPIYQHAWEKNWGELPMTDAEFNNLANTLKMFYQPELTYVAYIDGKAVGVFVGLPDFNQVLNHMNGRIVPFGWAKLLWYKPRINGMRILIMGVLEEYRLKGIEAVFYEEGARYGRSLGMRHIECSWILEDNYRVRRSIEMMGARIYRTYRIYDKLLEPSA